MGGGEGERKKNLNSLILFTYGQTYYFLIATFHPWLVSKEWANEWAYVF